MDVQIISPRVPFVFPRFARRHMASACPGVVSGLASAALQSAVFRIGAEANAHAILAHGVLPWGSACVAAANSLGAELCFIEHSAEDVLRLRRGSRLGEHYRSIVKHARRVLVVGEPMRAHLADHLGLSNVAWIPNGVDLHDAGKEPDHDAGVLPEPTVLAAGHYYRRKRYEELVECWPAVLRRCPRARLMIVTNAPPSLQSRVRHSGAGQSITLRPLMPAAELRSLMRKATLFALPSIAEAFGLVYAEALSEGTPVLMSRECGLASLVSSPDRPLGWVIDHNSPESLTDSLVAALNSPKECRQRGLAGQHTVRDLFTWEANAAAVLEALGVAGGRA